MTDRIQPLAWVVAVGLVVTEALPGQTPPDSLPPGVTMEMVDQGNAVFHGKGMCVNCHGADASGLIGPNLTDGEWYQAKGSYLSIVQVILNGVSVEHSTTGVEMPPRGGLMLGDVDVQAVAAYIWKLSHPEAGDSLPHGTAVELVRRGEAIFHGNDGCVRCHGSDATGEIGPDLTDGDWIHAKGSYLSIVNQILTGVSEAESTRGIPMPPRGGGNLPNPDVHAVAAYVWYIGHHH